MWAQRGGADCMTMTRAEDGEARQGGGGWRGQKVWVPLVE